MRDKIQFEVVEHIATVAEYTGGEYALELNYISFNGAPAKYDLRKWDKAAGRMLKGVTLSAEEAETVAAAIKQHRDKEKLNGR